MERETNSKLPIGQAQDLKQDCANNPDGDLRNGKLEPCQTVIIEITG